MLFYYTQAYDPGGKVHPYRYEHTHHAVTL